MYCRNCGNEVADNAIMCVACGVPPKAGKSSAIIVNPKRLLMLPFV